MVEPQPSKLMVWVRFPSPADEAWLVLCAHIAQAVEHFLGKEEVTGSSRLWAVRYLWITVWLGGSRGPKEKHAVWDVTTELAWWGLKAR